jgi:hypothetical protein
MQQLVRRRTLDYKAIGTSETVLPLVETQMLSGSNVVSEWSAWSDCDQTESTTLTLYAEPSTPSHLYGRRSGNASGPIAWTTSADHPMPMWAQAMYYVIFPYIANDLRKILLTTRV